MVGNYRRGVIISLLLVGLIFTGLLGFAWYMGEAEKAPQEGRGDVVTVQTHAPAPSPTPTTQSKPEDDEIHNYLVIWDTSYSYVNEWKIREALSLWDDPVPGISFATGDQCHYGADTCVVIFFQDHVSDGDAASTVKLSDKYYEIYVDVSDELYGSNFTRQGVICHEIGHVLGFDHHNSYTSCTNNNDSGFIATPVVEDLAWLNDPAWKPGQW